MTFDDAALQVLPYVAGCPADLIARAARDAAIEFCKDTRCRVTRSEVTFTTTAGTPAWNFAVDQIIDVIEARIDGEVIPVVRLNDPLADDIEDDVFCIRFEDANNLYIKPLPTASLDVELIIVTAPGPDSTEVHDSVWMKHHRALRDGALAELYEIPNRAWSNPQLSNYHREKFEAAKKKAESDYHRNVTMPARRLRVKPA